MYKRVLLTIFVLVLALLSINANCYSYQSDGNCVTTIKTYAEKIHHFPLYSLHGFLSLSAISNSEDKFFMLLSPVHSFINLRSLH